MASGKVFPYTAKDGTVSYIVRISYTDASGKRHQPQEAYKRKSDATKRLAQWLVEAESGQTVARDPQTVAELMTYWLETDAKQRARVTTLEDYETTIRVHIMPGLGHHKAQKLSPATIQRWYAEMRTAGHSEHVLLKCHQRLNSAYKMAMRLGIVPRNPLANVTAPRVPKKEMQVWSGEQAVQFMSVARESGYGPIWLVIVGTGMRRGEALGLRWKDVDFERGTLQVAQAVSPYKGHGIVQGTKTGTVHTVQADPVIMEALRIHRIRQKERKIKLGPLWHDSDLVFTANNGQPVHPDNLTRDYNRWVDAAGLPRIRVHDQRHTHVSVALRAGVQMEVISKRVGHARISTTQDMYTHIGSDMKADAARTIGSVLFPTSTDEINEKNSPKNDH